MFEIGEGLPVDRRAAKRWYRMAANSGGASAQMNLGLMLLSEKPGPARLEGLEWLRKAARRHYPRALYNLGVAYLRGDGVDENQKTGHRYIRKAAELGDENAVAYLASKGCS